ncbi:MAG: hypothetical protein DRI88_06720 [Bacteroidetes bacterium]|nr:MAG: hypothetical protein DRI88_06720 [Bacteroidota bacterium]RLD84255.1 MAG: hypothetical protein DRJ02_11980 [Bacteroidota bacterium]
MIREHIKKHDQLSLEIKLEFPASVDRRKKNNYFVNIYLFLPNALDVNKHSFTKQDFYNSLKTYIRLTTPPYSLQNIINGKNSPFAKLRESILSYVSSPDTDKKDDFELQVKRFCSIIGTALRRESNHILRAKNSDEQERVTNDYLASIKNIRSHFKELEKEINTQVGNGNAYDIYRFADEYQSLLVERSLFGLLDKLSRKKNGCAKECTNKLEGLVLEEMRYREERGYPSVAYTHRTNEDVLHRASRLKKFIESNLFLNTDTKKDGVIFEQIMFAMAAGLAMLFATAVAFASQMIYGNLTLPFFIALIISYMFKDRIKELVRIYFNKEHHKFFQDFKTSIYDQRAKKIGFLKESFQFIKHRHLAENIFTARNSMRSTEITKESMGEKIILYRNKIKIFYKKVKALNDFSGTTEILRLNIAHFTKNMDDPKKELFVRTKNGFKRSSARRSYHLNLILSYSNGKTDEIKLYKLIVDRNGINRIERIRNN